MRADNKIMMILVRAGKVAVGGMVGRRRPTDERNNDWRDPGVIISAMLYLTDLLLFPNPI